MPTPTGGSPSSSVADTGYVTIDALLSGYKWGNGPGTGFVATYSFPSGNATFVPGYTEFNSWNAMSATQVTNARAALQAWSNVANITFSETADTSSNVGDIRFAITNVADPGNAAHAYYPTGSAKAGDVWLQSASASNVNPAPGTVGFTTLLHEIGHAIGLKHSFQDFPILESSLDSTNYTVMSYTNVGNPVTPMLFDILAIQHIYGTNWSYHAGSDSYSLGSGVPMQTIWDGGGNDTITMLGAGILDLRQGQLFNISGINYAIAFYAEIENGVGSASADIVHGNELANLLYGQDGNDQVFAHEGDDYVSGGNGSDTLDGGPGNDTLNGGDGNDTYVVDSSGDSILELSGTDTVQTYVSWILAPDIENLTLLGSASYGVGNIFDNVIVGNDASNPLLRGGAGNDQLYGGAGDDWLEGDDSTNLSITGNDYIQGDDGNDTVLAGAGDDTVHGNNDTDTIVGEGGNDVLYGDAGIDYVDGRQGNDQLFGGDGNDIVFGDGLTTTYGFGGDTIYGDAGDDILMGESGDHNAPGALDVIYGGTGKDTIYGGSGNDWIFGGDGDDVIDGGDGSDFIVGGAGTDLMVGSGDSTAWGGPAATNGGDLFSYGSLADGGDHIYGFDTNMATGNDGIDLHNIFDAAGYAGSTPRADGYLFVVQNGANTDIFIDGNGTTGGANMTLLAELHNVTATDLADGFFLFQ